MSAAERDLPLAIEKWKDGSRHSRGAEERLGNVADDEEWVEGLAPRDIDGRFETGTSTKRQFVTRHPRSRIRPRAPLEQSSSQTDVAMVAEKGGVH